MSDPQRNFSNASVVERWSLPVVEGNVIGRPVDERKARGRRGSDRACRPGAKRGARLRSRHGEGERPNAGAHRGVGSARETARFGVAVHRPSAAGARRRSREDFATTDTGVGKQLARRELRIDPAQVIAIIRGIAAGAAHGRTRDPGSSAPEDAAIVRERLTAPSNERAWTIVEDPAMSRGGWSSRAKLRGSMHAWKVASTL